ncbi:MAG: Sjogren's syndrome/scleroderma autoantigen 1 family protein [Halobacteriota archaeon]
MSDFDKEAEREKLRKKFARDEKKRQQTQRMSELLLQGATMTNKHCDRCGDPIFRYDGEEFCPTCRAEGRTPASTANSDSQAVDGDDATQDGSTEPEAAGKESTAESRVNVEPATDRPEPSAPAAPGQGRSSSVDRSPTRAGPPSEPIDATDVSTARQSLVRTITKFTAQAEQTDDPRRARELLAAAREAAETLEALH